MQNSLKKMLAKIFADRAKRKKAVALVSVLSILVAAGVFWELMQPAVTMSAAPSCGLEEHKHTSDCYASRLACGKEEGEEHTHDDSCYVEVLVCGKNEHAHTDACYPEAIPEQTIVPLTEEETEAPEETPAATSTAEPTEAPTEVPTEAPTEAPEATEAAAPVLSGLSVDAGSACIGANVTWSFRAENAETLSYTLTDETGATVASGALEPDAAHVSWLADRAGTIALTLTAANSAGSVQQSATVQIAEPAALTAAVRGESLSCFAGESVTFRVTCAGGAEPVACEIVVEQDGAELARLDAFDESVTVTPADTGKATTITATVTLTDALGATASASCEIPCAVHDEESEAIWAKSARISATGRWPEDLIAVANTQVGYEESEIDFIIDEEGEKQGYTRYGHWYGARRAEWCGMFASFCLNYADVPESEFPREANCERWIAALKNRSLYASADGYTPVPGDLIFFDWEPDGKSDHVGIVTRVTDTTVYTIEGNAGKAVRERSYRLDGSEVFGYGLVNRAYENYLERTCPRAENPEAAIGRSAVVNTEGANLRAEPTAKSESLAQLHQGDVVTIESVTSTETEGDWYTVTTADGASGCIRCDLLDVELTAYEALSARADALLADENASDEDYEALAADIEAAYESGDITEEEYNALTAALMGDASVMTLEGDTAEQITVSFVINNGDYTSDPGSGETHLTVTESDYTNLYSTAGRDLTFTSWAGRYKVTGTGTLISYTIPAGTSLNDNGIVFPTVTVENIGTDNRYSYVAPYSWLKGTMLCTNKTVFNEDTSLELCLYESEETWSLNFVCGDESNHSVTYAVSGYPSATFTLGQSVSEEYIPTAEDVNAKFNLTWCDHGAKSGEVFAGWYLRNSATNEETEFTADVLLTREYADPNADRTIRVYADWATAPVVDAPVTVTFKVNGEIEETETRTLNSGDALGELPTPSVLLKEDGTIFRGWSADGGETYATADTVITADTTFVAIYAQKCTVTFSYRPEEEGLPGATAVTWYVAQGAKLADAVDEDANPVTELPASLDVEGKVFAGWYTEKGDEVARADMEMTISANTNFTANYSGCYTVTLHDINAEGEDVYEDFEIDLTSDKENATLWDYLSEHTMDDGVPAVDCVWYQGGKDVSSSPLVLDSLVTGDMQLYTYTYRLVLTIAPESTDADSVSLLDYLMPRAYAEVEVGTDAEGNLQLIITVREGGLKASDFVKDGVDYSLYTWKYTDANNVEHTLDIDSLIENGVTENITATSDGTLSNSSITKDTGSINFYVSINGEWTLWATKTMEAYDVGTVNNETVNSYCLTYAQLESIYGDFMGQSTYEEFWHTNQGNETIWGNRAGIVDGKYIQILEGDVTCDVYFMPNGGNEGSESGNKSSYADSNTFYTVTVSDPGGFVYASESEIPDMQYVLNGEETTVTLPAYYRNFETQVVWNINEGDLGSATVDGDMVSYSFTPTAETVIEPAIPEGCYILTYNINLPEGVTIIDDAPDIGGANTYTVTIQQMDDGGYMILSPSKTEFYYNPDTADYKYNSYFSYIFDGWMTSADGTEVACKPGAVSSEKMAELDEADNDKQITLYGKWSNKGQQGSVSFYVNMSGELQTYDGTRQYGTTIVGNAGWTDTVYGSTLTMSPTPSSMPVNKQWGAESPQNGEYGSVVIYDTHDNPNQSNVDSSKTADRVIKEDLETGVKASYGGEEITFTIGSVPSDETALAAMRKKQEVYIGQFERSGYTSVVEWVNADKKNHKIIYNVATGNYVPVDEINADNYSVRWYALKYEGNGWHIDGALIEKQAKLVISKTFYGDAAMIEKAKEDFKITVNGNGTSYSKDLSLTDGSAEVSADDNTYTWTLDDVVRGVSYTIKEEKYFVKNENEKTTSAEYRVLNPSRQTTVSSGWHRYDSTNGVTVVASAYADNETNYQKVQLLNSYVPENSLLIRKRDALGNALSGVTFTLQKKVADGQYESYDVYFNDGVYNMGSVEEVTPTNVLRTDSDGAIWLKWPETDSYTGEFRLEETSAPAGYTKVEAFTFIVNSSGEVTEVTPSDNDRNKNNISYGNGILTVIDRSMTTMVTVKKVWSGTDEKKPVRLTLLQGSTIIGSVDLDGKLDTTETVAWQHTWQDLDLFAGGEVIRYSVREEKIGDTQYDSNADTDGYADYQVTQTTTYLDESGTAITSGYENATSVEIVVTNTVAKNSISFRKIDSEDSTSLSGAQFTLYADVGCTQVLNTSVSDTNGSVVFDSVAPGTYYMKETSAPAGYQSNEQLYKVVLTGKVCTITAADDDTNTPISAIANDKIRNVAISLKKVDDNDTALSGAKFQLKKLQSGVYGAVGEPKTTDSNGKIEFGEIEPGAYQITETAAPAGYYKMTVDINFTVDMNGVITFTDMNDVTLTSATDDEPATFTVTNHTGTELPHTGGAGTLLYTIGGLFIMTASLLYGLNSRRKCERGERGK